MGLFFWRYESENEVEMLFECEVETENEDGTVNIWRFQTEKENELLFVWGVELRMKLDRCLCGGLVLWSKTGW